MPSEQVPIQYILTEDGFQQAELPVVIIVTGAVQESITAQ